MVEETKLSQLQLEMLERIKTTLLNMGCVFVIQLPDGTLTGHTEKFEVKEVRKRAPLEFERGEVRAYIAKHLVHLKPGEVAMIPIDKYGMKRIQSGSGNFCADTWGKGSCTTAMRPDKGMVEVMRTDGL